MPEYRTLISTLKSG